MNKIMQTMYRVDDHCESPVIYDNLDSAINCIRDLLDGIDVGYPIEITKIEMSQKKYERLPEL